MAPMDMQVAELQGLYGPFVCPERVLQKIWLQGAFAQDQAETCDGRRIVVQSPGRWNRTSGPDFRDARLWIDGRELRGDVEVHFKVGDWMSHNHEADPEYARVILHVLLFPPEPGARPARRADGSELPALALLPLLQRDLEEHASDDALEELTHRNDWERAVELEALGWEERRAMLDRLAWDRWRQKVRFAGLRLAKLGWPDAAHHCALEILGYRSNRAPMLTIAARYPLCAWGHGLEVQALLAEPFCQWQVKGVRPANHPKMRLEQYRRWVAARPEWPARLETWVAGLTRAGGPGAGADSRARLGLARQREQLAEDVLARAVGGSRLDNLVCDGFLPLAAAAGGGEKLFAPWFHWFLGDAPAAVHAILPRLGGTRRGDLPRNHGFAQGLIAWMLAREAAGK